MEDGILISTQAWMIAKEDGTFNAAVDDASNLDPAYREFRSLDGQSFFEPRRHAGDFIDARPTGGQWRHEPGGILADEMGLGKTVVVAALEPVWRSRFYGVFVLNRRVVLYAIDATPARWRGDAGSSPLDRARSAASSPRNDLVKNCRVHPTHWLISTQIHAKARRW